MTVAVIILSILLLSSWVNIYIIGKDDQFHWDEWLGCIVCILTTPILFFGIIRPIANKIYLARQKKKHKKALKNLNTVEQYCWNCKTKDPNKKYFKYENFTFCSEECQQEFYNTKILTDEEEIMKRGG